MGVGGAGVPNDSGNPAEPSLSSAQSFFHILNPNTSHRSSVRSFFNRHPDLPCAWVERTQHPTHLETILEWARAQGYERLAIWGGDGTFSRTVQWLWANNELKNVSLLLVPVGTGNDLARTLQLHPWKKTVQRWMSGTIAKTRIDAGLLSGRSGSRIFINNAGFGRSEESTRSKKPHPLKDILAFTPKRLQVEWDTSEAHCVETLRASLGIIFNAPYFNRGLFFDNTVSPSDGTLRAVLIPPARPLSLLWRFIKGRFGFSLSRSSDVWVSGDIIKIQSDENLYPQVDGERAFEKPERTMAFSVLREALTIFI